MRNSIRLPKFPSYQVLAPQNINPPTESKVTCTIKDRSQRIRMWIEQCFIVPDLSAYVREDFQFIAKFISVIDCKELLISFSEHDSLVFSLYL